jgi:hypothetical protein
MRFGPKVEKCWSWSFSRLKNFEVCPKRSYHYDIARDIREEQGEALLYGNAVHKAFENRLGKKKMPFPAHLGYLEEWAAKFDGGPGVLLVEQQYAIKEDFSPSLDYFGPEVWFRSKGDLVRLVDTVNGDHAKTPTIAHLVDWKTGKPKEDYVQLALMAQCAFSHYPTLQRVRTDYVWLESDALTTENFSQSDMPALWAGLLPRVQQMKHAHDTMTYPPKPGGLCRKYCSVEVCPHHGS